MKGFEEGHQERLAYWEAEYERRLISESNLEALEECIAQRQVQMNMIWVNEMIQCMLRDRQKRAHQNHH